MEPREDRVREQLLSNLSGHEMTYKHRDGVYRHVNFRNPENGFYWFDIVTWPGYLTIAGDLSSGLTFTRLEDMVGFFAGDGSIDYRYWAEKVDDRTYEPLEYRREYFLDAVTDRLRQMCEDEVSPTLERKLREAVDEHLRYVDLDFEWPAMSALADFSYEYEGRTFRFDDYYEMSVKRYSHQFILICHALRWACNRIRTWEAEHAG